MKAKYGWRIMAVCIHCEESFVAPMGNLYLAVKNLGCCPGCGHKVDSGHGIHGYMRSGEPFELRTVRWVPDGVWWNPWTWERGHWEQLKE